MGIKRVFLSLLVLFAATVSFAAKPVVLFDQSHGQRFVVDVPGDLNLNGLAGAMRDAGFEVRISSGPIDGAALSGVTALVSSGGFAPFSSQEIEAVGGFLKNGGNLAVMLHIAPTYEALLRSFRIGATSGVLRETENVVGVNSLDFKVAKFSGHPLTEGLDYFVVRGGWGVVGLGQGLSVIAETSDSAWIDLNRNNLRDPSAEPLTSMGVAVAGTVGNGRIAVFGDDAIFQDKFLVDGNRKLAENLALWFAGRK